MITSRLRSLIRRLRDRPALHRVVARLDAIWWAKSIRRAGVVDLDYVEAQLGRRLSERRAIRRYVAGGFRDGLRLNPLFVDTAVGDTLPEAHRVPALYAYLVADPRGLSISPAWDAVSYLERHPERADEPGGALGAAWRRRERDSVPRDDDSPERHVEWDELHRAILRAVCEARDDVAAFAGEQVRDIETDLVLLLDADEWDFDESLETAVAFAGSERTGATIAQIHGRAEDWVQATVIATRHPRIRAARIVSQDIAGAAAELSASSSAPVLVWRGPNEDTTVAAMRSLADEARAGAVVAPLWLDHDGTIAAAGATSDGRLLAGHPREDAADLPGSPRFAPVALAGLTMAGPKELLLAAGPGRDGAAAVGLTAAERGVPVVVRTDVITRSRAATAPPALPPLPRGADAVLHAAGWVAVDTGPTPRLRRSRSRRVSSTGNPVYRWAIRTAAPVGPRAEWWGDVHFARSLADALRRLDQEVVIDSYPARERLTTHLDDVTLSLRGPEPIDANATGTSILWVISHPEQIDRASLEGYDLVFAASAPWATEATTTFDRPVLPLLQCTDAYRFRPSGLPRGRDVVFVGTARGIYRPSVVDPVRAGVPLRVFGPDWRGWIPASAIAGNGVPNAELPALYEAAAAVMNDHWPSMKDRGFIANRPYDVVAAGGRVISDDVAGIADTFQGAVVTYRDADELLELLRSDLDTRFPAAPEMRAISELIRRRDSFDARARTLLDAVVATDGG